MLISTRGLLPKDSPLQQALCGDLCPILGAEIQTDKNMQIRLLPMDLLNNMVALRVVEKTLYLPKHLLRDDSKNYLYKGLVLGQAPG